METPKIEFHKLRDFGAKINAVVEFMRENIGKLFLCLLLIGGPAALLLSLVFKSFFGNIFSLTNQGGASENLQEMGDLFAVLGGNYLLMFFLSWLTITLIVSVTYTFMKLYNEGVLKEKSTTDIFRLALSKYGGLLALGFLISVVSMIGMIFFIIPGLYLGVVLSLAYPIYMFEDISVGNAFGRAFSLIREKWWSTFGLIIVTSIMAYVVQMVFSVPFLVVYFMNIFSLMEEVQTNPEDPSAIMDMFSSGYMTVAMAISMVGSYLTYSIPLLGLGYQYSNLLERSEGKGLMNEIENFDTK